ncbi:MAG: hypothetical protein HY280_02880 [Nitrospinae bacterium]|nr:hypothetical protein [Nitrospinota bacterium]
MDLHVQFIHHAKEKGLHATAKIIRAGSRLSTTRMEVRTDEGVLVVVGSGTFTTT